MRFVYLLIMCFAFFACSKNSDPKKPAPSEYSIAEIKDVGEWDIRQSSVVWKPTRDRVSKDEFSNRAYVKGCRHKAKFENQRQIDPALRISQRFITVAMDRNQSRSSQYTTMSTVESIDWQNQSVVVALDLMNATHSDLQGYTGPMTMTRPYARVRHQLVSRDENGKVDWNSQVLDMKLHPRVTELLRVNAAAMEIDCHLEKYDQPREQVAYGRVILKNSMTLSATKRQTETLGRVVCEKVEYHPFSEKSELEKLRGPSQDMGEGIEISVEISSNQIVSMGFDSCGGSAVLKSRVLKLNDGRVLQLRVELIEDAPLDISFR